MIPHHLVPLSATALARSRGRSPRVALRRRDLASIRPLLGGIAICDTHAFCPPGCSPTNMIKYDRLVLGKILDGYSPVGR